MSAPAYATADASELLESLARRTCSASAVLEASLARAAALEPRLHALLALDAEPARARAAEIDRRRERGETLGALAGLPVVLKANMAYAGRESNCGSRVLAGWRAPYSASFVERLLAADAVVLGISNMDEFAMGSSGENSAFGPTHNPWDLARTPGGSSSGSAAAVAAGLAPLALGSDTGGSVRQPAALCGISGFKPTWGRISRYGLIAFASSLDQVSPFARSVRDLELVFGVLAGPDERDSTCLDLPAPSPEPLRLDGLRIGVPREYFPPELDAGVRTAIEAALDELRAQGARTVDVSLPHTRYAIPTYYVVATAEASSNLARYDGVRYGGRRAGSGSLQEMFAATRGALFGEEVVRRILLGTFALSSGYHDAWYKRALRVRSLLARDFEQAFAHCDLIAGPTSPSAAFKLGERQGDPVAMYLSDALTVPASLAGLPALSVPCGFVQQQGARLPVGLQFIGPALADARVLAAGRAYQEHSDHHRAASPLALEELPA
jgi:aspartyl-tRNA(Asn)/glutamyl-tRNA(Gln) amidotransferase subunit A